MGSQEQAKIKALVVDDEETVRDFLKRFLEAEGLTVKTVSSGEQAVEEFRGENFDLVFIDARMSKMDGLATLRELKKIIPHSEGRARFIMMSGYSVDSMMAEAAKEGAYVYLKKPFEIEELARLITEARQI